MSDQAQAQAFSLVLVSWPDGREALITFDDYLLLDDDVLATTRAEFTSRREAIAAVHRRRLRAS